MASLRAICRGVHWAGMLLSALGLPGCNSPYPDSEEDQSVFYTTFSEEPKHLDPAQSYSTNESDLMWQVLEPPFQYHFLKRPYQLDPLTAREVPRPEKKQVTFRGKTVDATVYTVRIKPGILYQNHPCFVAANCRLTVRDMQDVRTLADIQPTGTRELVAADYVHAVRRLADPRLACPVFPTLAKNMLGMAEYRQELQRVLDEKRQERRTTAGPLYNQEQDEKHNPIRLDYGEGAGSYPFVREVGPYAFEVVLQHPYPQILYWMGMAFFAPVPPEAIEFFDQPAIRQRDLVFDRSPVGTGPYRLAEYDPTNQIVFVRNENFRSERYPDLAPPAGDDPEAQAAYKQMKAAGMLRDVGRALPMVDRIVFRMEREWVPRWNKFLQGYYDISGISSDTFDQAVTLASTGDPVLSDEMAARGIRLLTSSPTTVSYYAFNMNDNVVGGYTEEKRKLRQAISIAFDMDEQIQVFANGRGIPAQSPIPPGIFGYEEGEAGINPVVYRWETAHNRPVKRTIDEARKLLAEAGYPNGYGPDGQPLAIRFATTATGGDAQTWVRFVKKQFDGLNIRLVVEASDYNRFQDKVRSGNYQFLHWGWVADYPDPENFLFLLYSPNAKTVSGGENVSNYVNEEYDRLFTRMQSMENTPERLAIIRQMLRILREDAPWVFGFHPVSYGLYHEWCHNAYPHSMAYNTSKYLRIDAARRAAYRREYNAPQWWPVAALAVALAALTVPAVFAAVRHLRET